MTSLRKGGNAWRGSPTARARGTSRRIVSLIRPHVSANGGLAQVQCWSDAIGNSGALAWKNATEVAKCNVKSQNCASCNSCISNQTQLWKMIRDLVVVIVTHPWLYSVTVWSTDGVQRSCIMKAAFQFYFLPPCIYMLFRHFVVSEGQVHKSDTPMW